MSGHLTISATEFKAKCLDIFTQLADHRLSRVTVTRRGKPVAEVGPPPTRREQAQSLHGFMKGRVIFHEDVDLTQPVVEFDEEAFHRHFADLIERRD